MNSNHTDETITIFINSELRVSGDDANLYFTFPSILPNHYTHFYCEVLDFYGQCIQPNPGSSSRYSPGLDVFDLTETNYNSDKSITVKQLFPALFFMQVNNTHDEK